MAPVRYLMTAAVLFGLAACEGGSVRIPGVSAGGQEPPDELAPVGTLPPGVRGEVGEEGRELYRATCIVCHGERAEGTQLGPSLTDTLWLAGRRGTFEDIVAVVRDGAAASDSFRVSMHPRGDGTLTEEQVRAVAAYTYSVSRGGAPTPPP